MVWKPKEKELSMEEAIQLAKKELAPHWFGSSPLIAGVPQENGVSVFPLDPDFSKKNWLLFLLDSTHFSGEVAIALAKEWHKKYQNYHLNFLVAFVPYYGFLENREKILEIIEKNGIKFPLVLDLDKSLSKAFAADRLPKVILLEKGHRYFEYSDLEGFLSAELDIQNFLRSHDPGLPLSPIIPPVKPWIVDQYRFEFGFSAVPASIGHAVDTGFLPQDGVRSGKLHGIKPKVVKEGEVFFSGEWQQDPEKMMTSDPNAFMSFGCSSRSVALLAESRSKSADRPKVIVEMDGGIIYDSIAGEHLTIDDAGQSMLKVTQPKLYHIISNLPPQKNGMPRGITLRFTNADLAPLAVYGLRLGVPAP